MNQPSLPITAESLDMLGPDALAFAQSQFSGDVGLLVDGQWQWSAWLDPRGRVRALMQLMRVDSGHLRALPRGGRAEALAAAMRPFVMRAKVTLSADASRILRLAAPAQAQHVVEGPVGTLLGCGNYSLEIVERDQAVTTPAADPWIASIRSGHPWLPEAGIGRFVPQALSLERLGAISFTKGCFPGQEIAARLHYRGGPKQHLCRIASTDALEPGSVLRHEGKEAGMVLQMAACDGHHEGLAVLQDDIAALLRFQVEVDGRASSPLEVLQSFGA